MSNPRLISDWWQYNAQAKTNEPAIIQYRFEGSTLTWTWGALWERAIDYSRELSAAGVTPGDVCATVMHQEYEFYPLYLGIALTGAIPSVLAYPNPRLHPDKFRQGIEGMLQHSGFDWLLTETKMLATLEPLALSPNTPLKGILLPYALDQRGEHAPLGREGIWNEDALALIQHSSGTTGLQKPVGLSHRMVLTHLERLARAISLQSTDKIISWLPLYHDMGLIAAFHLPLRFGIPVVQIDPFEWVKVPVMLLQAVSETGATLGWLPNFAYNFIAERANDDELQGVRLDGLRMLVNCSEPIHEESHERFATRFAGFGFNQEALAASYAMAEATFAVTQTEPGRRAGFLRASRSALADGRFVEAAADQPNVRLCTSSGKVLDGCEIMVCGPDGSQLTDGDVGEVYVRSHSLFSGYRNRPTETEKVLQNGVYATGDLAFLREGELYVVGRRKDLIIVAGKNLYPQDIEAAVESVQGIIPGRVAAFGIENDRSGTEDICVMAETDVSDIKRLGQIRAGILKAGMAIDVTINRVELVAPRSLVKSSSGKIARAVNRDRLLAGLVKSAVLVLNEAEV